MKNFFIKFLFLVILIFIIIFLFVVSKEEKKVNYKHYGIIKLDANYNDLGQIQVVSQNFQNIGVKSSGFQGTNANLQAPPSGMIFNREDLNID